MTMVGEKDINLSNLNQISLTLCRSVDIMHMVVC